MFLLAYLTRIVELPYFREINDPTIGSLDNMFNAIWLTIVTITSVGYGDIFPHTNAGKVLAMIAALWGAFLMALLVVAASSSF